MSRFIKYASNLLDGVDHIAKDSLTDQDIAAAAAERRRQRRQLRQRESTAGGAGAELSEGALSEDGAHRDTPGSHHGRSSPPPGGRLGQTGSFDEGGGGGGAGGFRLDKDETGSTHRNSSSSRSGSAYPDFVARAGGGTEGKGARIGEGAKPLSSAVALASGASGTDKLKLADTADVAVASVAPPHLSVDVNPPAGGAPGGEGERAAAEDTPQGSPPHRYLRETPGATGGGAPQKEDGSVWSDQGALSSAFGAPSSPHRSGQGHADGVAGADNRRRRDGVEAAAPPPPQQPGSVGDLAGSGSPSGFAATTDHPRQEGAGGDDEGRRPVPLGEASSDSTPAASPRPPQQPLQQQQQRSSSLSSSPPLPPSPPSLRQDDGGTAGGVSAGARAAEAAAAAEGAAGRNAAIRMGDGAADRRRGGTGISPASGGGGGSSAGAAGRAGGGGGASGALSRAGSAAGESSPRGAAPSPVDSRQRQGLGNLLRMGGKAVGMGAGRQDVETLRAEAAELSAEVEELSLELEGAEERLRGQETELKKSAEKLMRQKAGAQERERARDAEMEEFRSLQLEEKSVFLANLEGLERKLKDKERDADEARSALSAIEAFAMEKEDAAARLSHEKQELLEELKGAQSGQDRSAEEVREALTRAEAEAEQVEARHRAWMRQAQARQTELEATAAQMSAALAEAKRKSPTSDEGSQRESQAAGSRKTHASDREVRALRDELDSCQASLELEQERTRSLQQEVTALHHDVDAARATEAVVERQRQEHANIAADAFAKASRLEKQLQQEQAKSQRLSTSMPAPTGADSQIQALSSKLLDKQARLEESVRERATLSVKLKDASNRAFRAEQELRESRGDSLETGGDVGAGSMRSRRRQQDRSGGGRASPAQSWSRIAPIAKHKKIASAVDVVDRNTFQAVVFLRKSSLARAVFLGYLLLIHLLAFMVISFHSSNIHPAMYPVAMPGSGAPSD